MASSSFLPFHRRSSSSSSSTTSFPSLLLLFSSLFLLIIFSLHLTVQNLASQTKTIIGHNLDPTPWHPFEKSDHPLPSSTIFKCSYLTCRFSSSAPLPSSSYNPRPEKSRSCPSFFQSIYKDLQPWKHVRISRDLVEEAGKQAAMRVTIVKGRVYVDFYYACVQSRSMFTIWGILQLVRRYPGLLPDVDLMFDCMDRPSVEKVNYVEGGPLLPPPLFRYCTTKDHFDIPFPDWSFWGWSEINIKPWDEEFSSIKRGSQATTWLKKDATAYWKGNPDVMSPVREALLTCNDTQKWGAQIMRQNWFEEALSGFRKSQLSNQCKHRYKIYAEGYAWSVSLKYILACGSLSLIIDQRYEDFITRGLIPKTNYWPINPTDMCQSIKSAVDWGNSHPYEAQLMGEKGQQLMEELDMDRVYDYMFHLLVEYSKLLNFQPSPPSTSQEVCLESVLCLADKKQRDYLERSYSPPSSFVPCSPPQA